MSTASTVRCHGSEAALTHSAGPVSANRQDLPTAYSFDHSFWVLRGRAAVFDPQGQQPWPCMGSRILPFETEGCRDVHDLADLETTAQWIVTNGIPRPDFAAA